MVSISPGNSKLGAIPSVSLPSIKTCIQCDCNTKCYARKIERLRKNVKQAYERNLSILRSDPDEYWREIKAHLMLSRYFRFHVSGDIPDNEYFKNMVSVTDECPHCEVLCFTKKYDIVNEYVAKHGMNAIPKNLHIVFSGWVGLRMVNPFCFPEAHVKYRDGSTTARHDAKSCGGNCYGCVTTETGCWNLKSGEQVVFNEH